MNDLIKKIDFIFNKLLPKKLIVFIMSCIFLFMNKIDGQMWFIISLAYLGINVTQKIPSLIKGNRG